MSEPISKDNHFQIHTFISELTEARSVKDRRREVRLLINLGNEYYFQSDYDQALLCYQESLTITREIKDRRLEGLTLLSMGWVYQQIEAKDAQYKQMLECHHQSLTIGREIGDTWLEGSALVALSVTYEQIKDHLEALKYSNLALAIARKLHNLNWEKYQLNRCQLAYEYCNNALSIAVELKNIPLAKECEELKKKVLMD